MTNPVSDALLQQAGIGGDPLGTASALVQQGQHEAARTLLEELVKKSPRRADAWFSLGQLHAILGELKPAAQAFKRAIQLAPDVIDGYVNLGNAYLRMDRLGQAMETYRNGLKLQPQEPLLHFNLGVALSKSGDLPAAIASYKTAISFYPSYAQAYFSLGNAYRDAGQVDEAETAYRNAVVLEPGYADAFANLAGLLATKEDFRGAIENCLKTVALVPNHPHALRNMSLSLYKLGEYEQGTEVTFRAIAAASGDTMLQYHMGEMLYGLIRAGKTEQAHRYARQWRETCANDPIAQHMAAAILGENAPDRADDTYVRETFDRFASDFESTLAGLGYRVPELLCGAMEKLLDGRRNLTILDAGCGTGLCAPLLKPLAKALVGVDLSGGMLAKAKARGLYDSLHEAELGRFLADTADRYDMTVAADVFCYFGQLDPTLKAIATKTKPGGLLGFTVEAMQGISPAEGFKLGPTGRYQHDEGYVRRALQAAGFSILGLEQTHGREEMGQPVPCFMVIARRD